jgi:hypothetical protein
MTGLNIDPLQDPQGAGGSSDYNPILGFNCNKNRIAGQAIL